MGKFDEAFSRGDLVRRVQKLERLFEQIMGARSLEAASIASGRLRSASFDGDLEEGDAGTQGWALGGDVAAFGSLFLRDGIIDPEALESPVDFSADVVTGLFDLTTTEEELLVASATIPEYATQVAVLAICFMEFTPTGDQVLEVRSGLSAPGFSGSTLGRQHGHTDLQASVTVPKSVLREDSDAFPLGGATVTATLEAKVNTGTADFSFAALNLLVLSGRPPTG